MSNRTLQISFFTWRALGAALVLLGGTSELLAGPVSSFDDVAFWTGSGNNRAAVAIDWIEDSTDEPALVWGFRWDGDASGEDMLFAVLEADPRLFAKVQDYGGSLGSALYGMGYDDGDGEFALDDDTVFNEAGIAGVTGPADGALPIDPNDRYREGWFTGVWHYGVSTGNPYGDGSWSSSDWGMSSRTLQDGDWDSWLYTPTFDFAAFAENPVAAEPPSNGDNADFNGDGVVDGADFLAWQRGFGTTGGAELEQGDANGDGVVDAADLISWDEQFGGGVSPPPAMVAVSSIPEPGAALLAALATSFFFVMRLR